jgi:hypothetical protein
MRKPGRQAGLGCSALLKRRKSAVVPADLPMRKTPIGDQAASAECGAQVARDPLAVKT